MNRPQFTPARLRPLTPVSYRAAVRRIRQLCDLIDARCDPQSPRERGSLTGAVNGLVQAAKALARRHRGESIVAELERDILVSNLIQPTPTMIAAARAATGDSQATAAGRVGTARHATWSDAEAGRTALEPARFALYLLLTDQHPEFTLKQR